jgi:hypothetical protein
MIFHVFFLNSQISYRGVNPSLILLSAFLSLASSFALAEDLTLPSAGCPMAHCDNDLSGSLNIHLPVIASEVSLVAHDISTKGSGFGLGCVSNGNGGTVACSLDQAQSTGSNLVVYDGDGNRKWSSNLFNAHAYDSAPMIDASGNVVATDNATIARFDSNGNVVWRNTVPRGVPFSPVAVNGTMIFIATLGGPVYLYSFTDGALLGTLSITDESGAAYGTVNTPSVNGSAVYVSLQKDGDLSTGELAKVLVNPEATSVLSVAWVFPFGGPSGASPVCNPATNTIYFDGSSQSQGGSGPSVLFAITDTGSAPQLKWAVTMPAKIEAAVTRDPRGGVWTFAAGEQYLWRFDETDGTVLQAVDVNATLGGIKEATNGPSSAMTITPNGVMILGTEAVAGTGPSYVAAIDLVPSPGALVWKYKIANVAAADVASGQFPIVVDSSGELRVVFTTHFEGAYFLTPLTAGLH